MKFQIPDAETQRQVVFKIYQRGPVTFILKRGLLGWAVPMFLFFTLYQYFVMGYHAAVSVAGLRHTATICIVAGLFVGGSLWLNVLRRYRQLNR